RNRSLFARGHEDRVVAEARRPARLSCDSPVERSGAAVLGSVRSEQDELGHVARGALFGVAELAEELRDGRRALRRVPGGFDPWTAAERIDLEAGVLREHPAGGVRTAELRLEARVVVVRRAGLRRVVGAVERLDRPAGEKRFELARLVRVAGAEGRSR